MKTVEEKAKEYGLTVVGGTGEQDFGYVAMNAYMVGYQEATRWISVDEELPVFGDSDVSVLAKNANEVTVLDFMDLEHFKFIIKTHKITHWRPI